MKDVISNLYNRKIIIRIQLNEININMCQCFFQFLYILSLLLTDCLEKSTDLSFDEIGRQT